MKLNPKVTGALAWTGLVLVLAVPAADMIVGKPDASANLVSDTKQVKPVAARPESKPAAQADTTETASIDPAAGADPVAEFVKSGKKLPSYISGSDAPAEVASLPAAPATRPATTPTLKPVKPGTITVNPDGTITRPAAVTPVTPATGTGSKTETGVASIRPELVAPVPLPASARPRPRPVQDAPLVVEEDQVALSEVVEPLLDPEPAPVIESDQLEEWDSGSLADYLRRKGLLEQQSSSATVNADGSYDPDGYYLDDGPNRPSRSRVFVIERGDDYW